MITRKETLNEIAELRYRGFGTLAIAFILTLVVSDVEAAIKAWKL